MTLGELEIIWHDWLRGVSLIGALAVLVVVYFLHIFTDQSYTMLLLCVGLAVGFCMAASVCLAGSPPLAVRLVAPLLAAGAAALGFIAVHQVVYPAEPFAECEVSIVVPSAVCEVPTDGLDPAWLKVKGRPGAGGSGDDSEITGQIVLAAGDFGTTVRPRLYRDKGPTGGKGKGISVGRKESDLFLVPGLPAGPVTATLTDIKPSAALPLKLSFHLPLLPPNLIELALALAVAVALVLAFFVARTGHFPFILPYTVVLLVISNVAGRGFSPDQPLLPFLGVAIGSTIGGSAAAYVVGKGMQKLLRREPRTPSTQ